jgi:HEAT repeat protein
MLLIAAVVACTPTPAKQDTAVAPAEAPVTTPPKYSPEPLNPELIDKAKHELLGETTASDPYLRCNALEALADVDPTEAPQPILDALNDPEISVRFAAIMAAGKIKLVDAHPKLQQMADDQDLRIQAAVRYALHRLGDTRRSHDLEKLATNGDAHVRGTVAQVLGLLGEPSAAPILVHLKADPVPSVRIQADEALWRLGDHRGLEDLIAYSISGYPDDQIIALLAIAAPKDERVLQHVRGQLQSDYTEVSLAAARACGMLGSDEGWNVAVPAAKSNDPRQRSLAALAMGAIGRSDLQPHLKELLEDPSDAVRISAATAILELRPPT